MALDAQLKGFCILNHVDKVFTKYLIMLYHVCMFVQWLLDQQDREDGVGALARTAWGDYNAGCAPVMFQDAIGWKEHFEKIHRKSFNKLMDLLGEAFVEYVAFLDTKSEEF